MWLSEKTKKSFQKWFILRKLKNISKGVRSTKMSSCNLTQFTKYATLHIWNYIFAHNFRAKSKYQKCAFSVEENELNKLDFG